MATAYSDHGDSDSYEAPGPNYTQVPSDGYWKVKIRVGQYGDAEIWPYIKNILESNLLVWKHNPDDLSNFKIRDDRLATFMKLCKNMLSGDLRADEPKLTILNEHDMPAILEPRDPAPAVAQHTGIYFYVHHSKVDSICKFLNDKGFLKMTYVVNQAPEEADHRVIVLTIRPRSSRYALGRHMLDHFTECIDSDEEVLKLGGETIWDIRKGNIPPKAENYRVYNEGRTKRRHNIKAHWYQQHNIVLDLLSEHPSIVETAYKTYLEWIASVKQLVPIHKRRENGKETLSQEHRRLTNEIYTTLKKSIRAERKRPHGPIPQRFAECTVDHPNKSKDGNIDTSTMMYKCGAYKNAKYIPTGIDKTKLDRLFVIRSLFKDGRYWKPSDLSFRLFVQEDGRAYEDDHHLCRIISQRYFRAKKKKKN